MTDFSCTEYLLQSLQQLQKQKLASQIGFSTYQQTRRMLQMSSRVRLIMTEGTLFIANKEKRKGKIKGEFKRLFISPLRQRRSLWMFLYWAFSSRLYQVYVLHRSKVDFCSLIYSIENLMERSEDSDLEVFPCFSILKESPQQFNTFGRHA